MRTPGLWTNVSTKLIVGDRKFIPIAALEWWLTLSKPLPLRIWHVLNHGEREISEKMEYDIVSALCTHSARWNEALIALRCGAAASVLGIHMLAPGALSTLVQLKLDCGDDITRDFHGDWNSQLLSALNAAPNLQELTLAGWRFLVHAGFSLNLSSLRTIAIRHPFSDSQDIIKWDFAHFVAFLQQCCLRLEVLDIETGETDVFVPVSHVTPLDFPQLHTLRVQTCDLTNMAHLVSIVRAQFVEKIDAVYYGDPSVAEEGEPGMLLQEPFVRLLNQSATTIQSLEINFTFPFFLPEARHAILNLPALSYLSVRNITDLSPWT